MNPILMLARREVGKASGIGLGWLLAISLGGGLLLCISVGLLITWYIKSRPKPSELVVYTYGGVMHEPSGRPHRSSTKNGERALLKSESSLSRLSSRLSMTLPPVLPPLPSYNSFSFGAAKKERTRSWIDEEALHGPPIRRLSFRDSWFSKDGWVSGSPTLPNLEETPSEKLTQTPPEEQKIEVQKRQTNCLNESQTEPDLPSLTELPRGRPRIPPLMPIRSYATESDLRDILASTEERLRAGGSLSPEKNTRTSPTRSESPTKSGSPGKTPHSGRTSILGHGSGQMTPSPTKRSSHPPGTPTPVKTHSRNASITSIGSVANSLIRQATAELELPGGMSSPSRMRGKEWDAPQHQKQPVSQPQYHWQQDAMDGSGRDNQPYEENYLRRVSMESDISSALSTLYSVEEPEEETRRTDDPFVVKGTVETRPQLTGPRPLRRAKTIAGLQVFDESAVPAPLRTISVNTRPTPRSRADGPKTHSLTPVSSDWLSPPAKSERRNLEDVRPKSAMTPEMTSRHVYLSPESSEASLVSCSVHSIESNTSEEEEQSVTPRAESFMKTTGYRSESSSPESYSTPIRRGGLVNTVELGSSPLDEREVLSILAASPRTKRELPIPPSCATGRPNSCILPTALSPRPSPRNAPISPPSISRRGSFSSSVYDMESIDGDQHTELPRGLGSTMSIRGQTVGNTIAELRRTNSVVSSYSVASIASTFLSDTLADSPSIPSMRGGGFSPLRTNSKNAAAGNRNYLSLGGINGMKNKKGEQTQSRQPQHSMTRSRSALADFEKKDKTEADKENQVLSLKTVRFELCDSPREGRLGPSLTVPLADTGIMASSSSTEEQERRAVQPQRQSNQSMESAVLYDKDGFLLSSPPSEKNNKGGQWRM